MDTEASDTPGARLREFIDARWTRRNGGIRGLSKKLGVSAETMYAWFRGDYEPNLDQMSRLADALSATSGRAVSRAEILAAMDGGAPLVPLDSETTAMVTELVERLVNERLGPRK